MKVPSLLKSSFSVLLQVALGGMFIFSGVVKLYPVEPFEASFVDIGIANWHTAPFIARFLISVELILGLSLILHIFKKYILYATIGLLAFFTFYLFFVLIKDGNTDNCGCFGTFLEMTPLESVFKNIFFIGIALYLLKFGLELPFANPVLLVLNILMGLAIPYILNVPDAIYGVPSNPNDKVGTRLEIEKIGDYNFSGKKTDISKGVHIVLFMSLECSHCKLAALKINTIKKTKTLPPISAIFLGEAKDTTAFFKESNGRFDHFLYNGKQFLKLSGTSLPAIYVLKDGIIRKKIPYQLIYDDSFTVE